jgi:hypothetical protein
MSKIIFFLLVAILSFCKGDKNANNDPFAILLGVSPKYSPTITSLTPKKVAPEIQSSIGVYPATEVIITGRNFSTIPEENILSFNGVSAPVIFSSPTEIRAKVPSGVTSGLLSVSRPGGSCYSLDKKSGINCSATEFYVDCYTNYKNVFGEEILLTFGKLEKIEYDTNGTKAFRVDLPSGDYSLNILCSNAVIVQRFTNTCVAIDEFKDNSNLLINPQIPVTGGFTLQFFISTTKGTCTIGVL